MTVAILKGEAENIYRAEYLSDRLNHGQSAEQWTGRTLATLGCWRKWAKLIGQGLAVQAEARLEVHFQFPNATRGTRDPGLACRCIPIRTWIGEGDGSEAGC